MCVAVAYEYNQVTVTQHFSHARACLPVKMKDGALKTIVWGRREIETGNLPEGSGLFLEDIRQGRWDEFFPQPVKLPVRRFAMLSAKQKLVWFELLAEHLMQGVVMHFNSERRCYCAYIKTYQPDHPFSFWPRLLYRGEQLELPS